MKKSWVIDLADGKHRVEMELGGMGSNKRKIHVDGRELNGEVRARTNWLGEGDYEFEVAGKPALASARTNLVSLQYDLAVGGISVTTGKPVLPMAPLPGWGWVFIAACILIPILSLGGAMPMILGVGGSLLCAAIARNASKPTGQRVLLCAVVTGLAWVLFVVLLVGVALLRTL